MKIKLFEVVNTIAIGGQWLMKNDTFDVFATSDKEGVLYVKNKQEGYGCRLPFSCVDIEHRSHMEILSFIHARYPENTFEIINKYAVDLI